MISFWKFCSNGTQDPEFFFEEVTQDPEQKSGVYISACAAVIQKQPNRWMPSHRGTTPWAMDPGPCGHAHVPTSASASGLCPCAPHTKRRLPLAGDGESHGSLNFPITSINQRPGEAAEAGAGCCKSSHSPQEASSPCYITDSVATAPPLICPVNQNYTTRLLVLGIVALDYYWI